VVLYTDSVYLLNGLTDFIWKWVEDGFINTKGHPVIDTHMFKSLHTRIRNWQKKATEINFWKLAREDNRNVDTPAKSALE